MTIEEAQANIGKPFKYFLCRTWDIIKDVRNDGVIVGEWLEAPAEDCRLKQEQPEALKQFQQNKNDATKSSEGDSLCQP